MTEISNINWKQTDDGRWLAYDENNLQIIGWVHQSSDDKWFYCYSDDIAKNWFKDSDGRWYYFSPCQQVTYGHQYYVGEMMVNWVEIEDKWYYLIPNSIPSEGLYRGQTLINTTEEIDGVNYNFNTSGEWVEDEEGVSDKCAEFIGSWEGFYSKAYADPYYGSSVQAYWTIGFGTCYCVHPEAFPNGLNSTITREYALELLKDEANKCYFKIVADLKSKGVTLNSDQISSLVSFSYNCGISALFGSSLYKNICNGVIDENTIMNCFRMWNKANGQYSNGLDRRRIREANIFSKGIYENN